MRSDIKIAHDDILKNKTIKIEKSNVLLYNTVKWYKSHYMNNRKRSNEMSINIDKILTNIIDVYDELDKLEYIDPDHDDLELEKVSLNSQIIGIRQILRYCQELDKAVYEGV